MWCDSEPPGSFWYELSQFVDAQLPFERCDLIDNFERGFVAEQFVFLLFEVVAQFIGGSKSIQA